jgi:tRNA U34 5-carboxymethylaminomethyl modifying enzyme MnmG/GidA
MPFSYMNETIGLPDQQIDCYQTKTNQRTHQLIWDHLHLTIHLKEDVKGPRYVIMHVSQLELKASPFFDQKILSIYRIKITEI